MTSTARFPRLAQRHAAIWYALAVAPILAIILDTAFPAPVTLSVWAIAQGVGIVWIGTGAWEGRERWAARAQVTLVGLAIVTLISSNREAGMAAVGLAVFVGAVLFLHFCHTLAHALYNIQDQLVSVRWFTRTEAARQTLYFLTFAGPATIAIAPSITGIAFLTLITAAALTITGNRARRRLHRGLSRGGDDA